MLKKSNKETVTSRSWALMKCACACSRRSTFLCSCNSDSLRRCNGFRSALSVTNGSQLASFFIACSGVFSISRRPYCWLYTLSHTHTHTHKPINYTTSRLGSGLRRWTFIQWTWVHVPLSATSFTGSVRKGNWPKLFSHTRKKIPVDN